MKDQHAMPNFIQRFPIPWFAILLAVVYSLTCASAQVNNAAPKRLVAYYLHQEHPRVPAYATGQIPFKKLTHLIEVTMVINPSGDGSVTVSAHAGEDRLVQRAHAAGVRVLACVQGAEEPFRKMAATEQSRARFVASVKEFVVAHSYDGMDLDWEVPEDQTDVADNVLLMRALRDALPAPRFLLSMATPSEPGQWGIYDFAQLNPSVDFYNVMTYDFHGPWTSHAGHNSPLFSSAADPDHDGSLDATVNLYLNKLGVPPEKINLGTAFYGYEFPAAPLYGPCNCEKTTAGRDYGSYIKPRIGKDGWVQSFDPIAMAPYLVRTAPAPGFITYDDPASTARKVAYALEVRGLGGVFMWELSQDYDGHKQDLLDSMYKSFRQIERTRQ
jgi:chitinase